MTYKAIISDVDGTIVPLPSTITPNIKPTNILIEFVKKLRDKNFYFSIATGKPYYLVEQLIDHLSLTSPIIVDNGAAIYDPVKGVPLWQSFLDKNRVQELLSLTQPYNKRIRISDGKESCDVTDTIPSGMNPIKILVMSLHPHEVDEYMKKVETTYKDLAIVKAQSYNSSSNRDIYITNAEATKQHAVLKLAEILGIRIDEMIGIGDHYNDFPLLMACGLKVAMGNAVPELKEIADYIAPSVEEDGVADVIEKFVLNPVSSLV